MLCEKKAYPRRGGNDRGQHRDGDPRQQPAAAQGAGSQELPRRSRQPSWRPPWASTCVSQQHRARAWLRRRGVRHHRLLYLLLLHFTYLLYIHSTITIHITYSIRAYMFVLSRFSHGIRTQRSVRGKQEYIGSVLVANPLSALFRSRFSSSLSVLDFLHMGSSLSLRAFSRLGSALSVMDFVTESARVHT